MVWPAVTAGPRTASGAGYYYYYYYYYYHYYYYYYYHYYCYYHYCYYYCTPPFRQQSQALPTESACSYAVTWQHSRRI